MSMELISKEAVLKLFATHDGKYLYEAIRELPSVKQKPKTQFVEKSNFDIRQYNADLQSAYDCGKASQEPKTDVLDKIKKEIYEQKNCVALDDDLFCLFWYISGLLDAIEIIDKYRQEG